MVVQFATLDYPLFVSMTSSYDDAAVNAAGIGFNFISLNRLPLLQTKFVSTYHIE